MTVSAIAVVLALVVVVVLVRRHVPEGGLRSWLRESFAAWKSRDEISSMRSESARLAEPSAETGDLRVADILAMAEEGQAYHRPVDLRAVVASRRSN